MRGHVGWPAQKWRGGEVSMASEPSVTGQGERAHAPTPSLTVYTLLPQKVTLAAETKIYPQNRTPTDHMPE